MALKVGELYATLELKDNNLSNMLNKIANNFNSVSNKIEDSMEDVVDSFEDAEDAVDSFEDKTDKLKPADIPAPKTKNFTKALEDIANKAEQVGKTLSTSITLPIVGVGTTAVMTGAQFEQAMANVQAITNATGEDFKDLEDKAKEMGASTKFSASQSADAMSYLGMAGWDTTEILAGIEPVLQLSIASGSELATVADIVSDALTGFGMSADETGRFTDILAQVSRKANTNVEILGESFKYSSSLMGSMKYSAEDTAIALGLMANAGVKGSSAGTALSGALARLIDPTEGVATLMEKYNISLTDSEGNMLPLIDVMDNMREQFGKLDTAERNQVATQLFGMEAMKGMLAIVNASDDAYDSLKDSIYNSNGAADEMAGIMGDTLQGRIDSMKSAIEGGLINVFEQLQPMIEDLVKNITDMATWLAEADEETVKWVINLGGILAVIGPIISIVSKFVKGVIAIKNAFIAVKGALLAWTGATTVASAASIALGKAITIATGPVGWIVAAIAAAVAAGIALWKNWDWVKEKAGELANWLGQKWEEIKQWCTQTFSAIGSYISNKWSEIVASCQECWNNIKSFLSSTWETLKNIVQVGLMLMAEIIKGAFQILMIPFNFIWQNFGQTLTTAWNTMRDFLVNIWNSIKAKLQEVFGPFVTFISNIWNNIQTSVYDSWNAIRTSLINSWNSIKTACSEAWNSLKTTISNKWNEIKTGAINSWNNIKSSVSAKWNEIKSSASTSFNSIKSTVGSAWDSIKSSASSKWESIKTSISGKWDSIKNVVKNGVNALKNFMNFNWSLPKIKLPHFKIKGKFSLNPPSVPSFGIEWYKRGGMFDSPTVVGLGEAGREGIVPFSGMSNKSLASELAQLFADAGGFGGGGEGITIQSMTVREEADITRIAQELHRLQQKSNRGRR